MLYAVPPLLRHAWTLALILAVPFHSAARPVRLINRSASPITLVPQFAPDPEERPLLPGFPVTLDPDAATPEAGRLGYLIRTEGVEVRIAHVVAEERLECGAGAEDFWGSDLGPEPLADGPEVGWAFHGLVAKGLGSEAGLPEPMADDLDALAPSGSSSPRLDTAPARDGLADPAWPPPPSSSHGHWPGTLPLAHQPGPGHLEGPPADHGLDPDPRVKIEPRGLADPDSIPVPGSEAFPSPFLALSWDPDGKAYRFIRHKDELAAMEDLRTWVFLAGADLQGVDFQGKELDGACLAKVEAARARFSGDLSRVTLSGIRCAGASFSQVRLHGDQLQELRAQGALFEGEPRLAPGTFKERRLDQKTRWCHRFKEYLGFCQAQGRRPRQFQPGEAHLFNWMHNQLRSRSKSGACTRPGTQRWEILERLPGLHPMLEKRRNKPPTPVQPKVRDDARPRSCPPGGGAGRGSARNPSPLEAAPFSTPPRRSAPQGQLRPITPAFGDPAHLATTSATSPISTLGSSRASGLAQPMALPKSARKLSGGPAGGGSPTKRARPEAQGQMTSLSQETEPVQASSGLPGARWLPLARPVSTGVSQMPVATGQLFSLPSDGTGLWPGMGSTGLPGLGFGSLDPAQEFQMLWSAYEQSQQQLKQSQQQVEALSRQLAQAIGGGSGLGLPEQAEGPGAWDFLHSALDLPGSWQP